MPRSRFILLVALLAAGTGCAARAPEERVSAAEAPRTLLRVDNRNFYDMDVYLVRFGQRYRLGTATGNGTSTFEFPSQLVEHGPVRFVASPVGGAGRTFTEELDVRPGDVVSVEITP